MKAQGPQYRAWSCRYCGCIVPGGYAHKCAEYDLANTNGAAVLVEKRDMLLRELEALRNQVAGLSLAIDIVADELAASGMSAFGQDPKGLEAKPASPVGEAETPKASSPSGEKAS